MKKFPLIILTLILTGIISEAKANISPTEQYSFSNPKIFLYYFETASKSNTFRVDFKDVDLEKMKRYE